MSAAIKHEHDSDCTLDELGECTICFVYHGDPCPSCNQRAFHSDDCNRPCVTDVVHGWSMIGHYFVSFSAREGKTTYVKCESKKQAQVLADALKGATMAGSP